MRRKRSRVRTAAARTSSSAGPRFPLSPPRRARETTDCACTIFGQLTGSPTKHTVALKTDTSFPPPFRSRRVPFTLNQGKEHEYVHPNRRTNHEARQKSGTLRHTQRQSTADPEETERFRRRDSSRRRQRRQSCPGTQLLEHKRGCRAISPRAVSKSAGN